MKNIIYRHSFIFVKRFIFFITELIFTLSLYAQQNNHALNDTAQYLPFAQIVNLLEEKYNVRIFYKPEWFLHKKFHQSIITLPLKEAIDRINSGTNYTALFIHQSVIFVYKESFRGISSQNEGIIIVGNPNEYGRYPIVHLSGHILDGATKKPLIGAVLYENKLKIGAVTDRNGAFSMDLPAGEHDLKLSYVGYEDSYRKIRLLSNGSVDLDLFEKTIHLNDVVISSREAIHNITLTQMSMIHMNSTSLQELPHTLGESDILKSVSFLPGIQTVGEFGSGFNVRGGSSAQNLILLEGVPVYNLSHVFGLISAINSDGIKNFTLWKAGIPARYGDGGSSVMDIQMGPANPDKLRVTGGIGLINSKLNINIPAKNKKSFLLLGARSSYSNWLLRKMPDEELMNSAAGFYDFNAQFGITMNPKNKISLFTYHSSDRFAYGKNTLYTYGNTLGSVKWKHIFGSNLSTEALAGYSNYFYDITESDTLKPTAAYRIQSQLNDYTLKWNTSWVPGDHHSVNVGINASIFNINPGKLIPYGQASSINPIDINTDNGLEWAAYASDNIKISSRLNAEIGIRYSHFSLMGPGKVYVYKNGMPKSPDTIADTLLYNHGETMTKYTGLAPRIALRYILSDNSSVKISYNRIFQYLNLISNTAVMAPTDVWKLSDTYFKPLMVDQVALGYFRNFRNNTLETSVEVYFKKLKNVTAYKNGATILLNKYLESDLISAEGTNYGMEFYIKKNTGRLTGWISYTWSRSFLQSNGVWPSEQINHNKPYPSDYDKPHNFVLNINYHISRRLKFAGTFTYNTGRPVTLPELRYFNHGQQLIYYSSRNKYRLPDYHRLDLSITLNESLRLKRKWKGNWTLSVINVYGRKNAYSVYYQKDIPSEANHYQIYNLYKLYIIGRPLPTLTYNFKF